MPVLPRQLGLSALVALLCGCNDASFAGSKSPASAPAPAPAVVRQPASANAAAALPSHPASGPQLNHGAPAPPTYAPSSGVDMATTTNAPGPAPAQVPAATATAVDDGVPKPPRDGCKAFVTGLILSDRHEAEISRVYEVDGQSELVGSGRYASNAQSFPKANKATFDGIALDPGTHIVVYADRNFQGQVVFEGSGPLVLNNVQKSVDYPEYFTTVMQDWDAALQAKFPQSTRQLSQTDMVAWGTNGSSIVTCD